MQNIIIIILVFLVLFISIPFLIRCCILKKHNLEDDDNYTRLRESNVRLFNKNMRRQMSPSPARRNRKQTNFSPPEKE